MNRARVGKRIARWALAAAMFAASSAAYAQGCAMCYTSASAAKAAAIQALRSGILILLIPALLVFAAIFVIVFRRRNQFHECGEWTREQDEELQQMLARLEPVNPEKVDASCIDHSYPVS